MLKTCPVCRGHKDGCLNCDETGQVCEHCGESALLCDGHCEEED